MDDLLKEIEKLRAANRELQEKNERLHQVYDRFVAVLNGIDAYIHVTDTRDYTILFGNNSAKNLFGTEIEGQICYEALRQESGPCLFCKIPRLLAATSEADRVLNWESFNPLTGKWFFNSERIVDWPESPRALLTVGTDITAVKKAEEEKQLLAQRLHQAQKMEAIGVLAGSIAHDLNNILSGVVSYPDLLLAKTTADDPMRKALETIRAAGNKGVKIVQDLLTLSRKGMRVEEPVSLGQLLAEYLESPECQEIMRRHERVEIVAPDHWEPLLIKGSPVHLSNVLMNLVNNAAEAMPDGGIISIRLGQAEFTEQPPGFTAWRPGPYGRITVSDTGTGIAAEHLERIFEPFFSLKQAGSSGTGLGLAVVWGTVTDHRGYIEIETAPGAGTSFHIYLPTAVWEKQAEPRAEEPVLMGEGQSILVVDDDEHQRQIASEMLAHLGYRVTVAESGEKAIRHLRENPVELVILDMLMPGMDGLETYRKICGFRPGQKAIIVSGYSRSERVKEAQELGVGRYLQKPYTLAKIGKTVFDTLAG